MPFRRLHYGIAIAITGVAAVVLMLLIWWFRPGVDLARWRSGPPPAEWSARVRQEAKWREEGSDRRVVHAYRPLSAISEELQLAVLVGEDIDFFGHGALDMRAVREAIDEWRHGRRLRGASTISQQLAKTLFLSPERSLARKLEEARLASRLESDLGKARVLELYLNVVEFGPGLLGAEAAAQRYFGAAARDLTRVQAAELAAAIPSPGRDNPSTATRRWVVRKEAILVRMEHADWLRRHLRGLQ